MRGRRRRAGTTLGVALLLAGMALAPEGAHAQTDVDVPILPVRDLRPPPAPAEGVVAPIDMARAPDGETYILDGEGCRVIHLDAEDRLVGLLGGCGHGQGRLYRPFAIAAGAERVYVAEEARRSRASFGETARIFEIEVYDREGTWLYGIRDARAMRTELTRHAWEDTNPLMRALHEPVGLDVAADGTLHVLDAMGRRWSRFGPDGALLDARAPSGDASLRVEMRSTDFADRQGRVAVGDEEGDVLFAIWPHHGPLLRYERDGDDALLSRIEPADGDMLRDVGVTADGHLLVAQGGGVSRREQDGRWLRLGPPTQDGDPPVLAIAAEPGGVSLLRGARPEPPSPLALARIDEASGEEAQPRWGPFVEPEGWLSWRQLVRALVAHDEGGVTVLSQSFGGGGRVVRIDELGRLEPVLTRAPGRRVVPLHTIAEWPDGRLAMFDMETPGRILRYDPAGEIQDVLSATRYEELDLAAVPDGDLLVRLRPTPTATRTPRPTRTPGAPQPYPPPRTATSSSPYPAPVTPTPRPSPTDLPPPSPTVPSPTPPPTPTRPPEQRVFARIDAQGNAREVVVPMEAESHYDRQSAGTRFTLDPSDESLLLLDRAPASRILVRRVDARSGQDRERILVDPGGAGPWFPALRELRAGPDGALYAVGNFNEGPRRIWQLGPDGRVRGGWSLGQGVSAGQFAIDREARLWQTDGDSLAPLQLEREPGLVLRIWAARWPDRWHASLHAGRHLAGAPRALTETGRVDPAAFGPALAELLTSGAGASARFQRPVALEGGRYAITLRGQGGARLWVDDALLVDRWHETAYDKTVERFLPGTGARRFVLETRSAAPEDGGAMDVALSWERLGEAHAIFLPWGTTELGPSPIPLPTTPPPSPTPAGYPGP